MTRSCLLILSILLLNFSLFASPAHQEAVDRFVSTSGVPSGSLAIKIIDLKSKKTLASHNSDIPLTPASIMKAVTTAALYGEAGPNYRYDTKIYVDGPVNMGVLRGNLIIEGSCDPSLHSRVEPYGNDLVENIVATLKKLYVNEIEGEIIIDESQFEGPARPDSWSRGDFNKSYGTGSHAFNFANNSSGDVSVENPQIGFLNLLKNRLNKEMIMLKGKNLGEGKKRQVNDHFSSPLDEIMRSCMMRSDNLFAECMLRTYGKLKGADGSTAAAAAIETNLWKNKGYPLQGVNIVDGSGLSRQNKVTADFMGAVLTDMSTDAVYASFFPLAGQEGTLRKFLSGTSLDSYIAMKTGSMTGIQCYAGYKLDDDYVPTHVVVIIMNDIPGDRDKVKKAAEKMLLEIFKQ